MKRNHWVAQAYLRNFAADSEKRERIWRFSKSAGDPELKSIKKVAVRFNLYAPRDACGKRDYAFEKKLSELEQWFGTPLWYQVCHQMIPLQSDDLRKIVALIVAVTYLRNPMQLEHWKSIHRKIVHICKHYPELPATCRIRGRIYKLDISDWAEYRDADENALTREWIRNISCATWLAEILIKMRWSIVFSNTPVFVTTDQPVTIVHPSLAFRGLEDPDTTVMFPLSPTRILVMDNKHDEPDGQYYPLKVNAACYNFLLWRNAIEHMFSHCDPDIVCAAMVAEAQRVEARNGFA